MTTEKQKSYINFGVTDGIYIYYDVTFYRFCEGNFVGEMESTIGVDFYLSEIDVDGKKIKVC